MSASPHQPTDLATRITEYKDERDQLIESRKQILTLGQTTSSAGLSTTYPSLQYVNSRIAQLTAWIDALTAQLNGDCVPAPGIALQQFRSDYV